MVDPLWSILEAERHLVFPLRNTASLDTSKCQDREIVHLLIILFSITAPTQHRNRFYQVHASDSCTILYFETQYWSFLHLNYSSLCSTTATREGGEGRARPRQFRPGSAVPSFQSNSWCMRLRGIFSKKIVKTRLDEKKESSFQVWRIKRECLPLQQLVLILILLVVPH